MYMLFSTYPVRLTKSPEPILNQPAISFYYFDKFSLINLGLPYLPSSNLFPPYHTYTTATSPIPLRLKFSYDCQQLNGHNLYSVFHVYNHQDLFYCKPFSRVNIKCSYIRSLGFVFYCTPFSHVNIKQPLFTVIRICFLLKAIFAC